MDAKTLDFVAEGRSTRRYHAGLEMHEYQRIDAHSYGVAMFTVALTPDASPERRSRLLMAALVHDLPECKTGDLPAPFKRSIPNMREQLHAYEDNVLRDHGLLEILVGNDARALAIADSADGLHHCLVEMKRGNGYAKAIALTFWDYLVEEQRFGCDPLREEKGEPELRRWLGWKATEAKLWEK
jgi:5'-deoxynucleotidase YfbR-like HD superfamily hydrolase